MKEWTHFDQKGNAHMVDVSEKKETARRAVASGKILMERATFEKIKEGDMKKGDVLGVSRIAGIMAMKNTSNLIPLCHPLPITGSSVDFTFHDDESAISVRAICKVEGKTGVEMEALTGASVALLTIYDMCKAVDKNMTITSIQLEEKEGGKSGPFHRKDEK